MNFEIQHLTNLLLGRQILVYGHILQYYCTDFNIIIEPQVSFCNGSQRPFYSIYGHSIALDGCPFQSYCRLRDLMQIFWTTASTARVTVQYRCIATAFTLITYVRRTIILVLVPPFQHGCLRTADRKQVSCSVCASVSCRPLSFVGITEVLIRLQDPWYTYQHVNDPNISENRFVKVVVSFISWLITGSIDIAAWTSTFQRNACQKLATDYFLSICFCGCVQINCDACLV